jgi:hypothetical protein
VIRTMKKQIHPAAKAYPIRGAFYLLLLLLALSTIPFALAQSRSRGTTKGIAAKLGSTLPAVPQFSGDRVGARLLVAPSPPKAPQTVLYDQYNNAGANVTASDSFTDLPTFSADLADDFVVPAGQTWAVQSIDVDGTYFVGAGPATDWNVLFYVDNAGFPGAQIFNTTHQPVQRNGRTFTINLPTPAMLNPGTYWVEIQANMTYGTQGQWGWTNRTVTSHNAAVWRNPAGGLGSCRAWGRRGATCGIDPSAPDQVYRLNGTIAGAQLGNISTRAFVQTGDNVMIGGFIVQGTAPKRVIIRAIGPELTQYGVPNPMADPTLELHDGTGALIASNDNWQQTIIGGIITVSQVGAIQGSGHVPGDPRESAIIAELPPGNYTAIVRGLSNTTGVALAEVYNLSSSSDSILRNISTRSFVQTGDNIMIGGFIVQGSTRRVVIRAIGPELSAPPYNIPNALANPTLELHNGSGALIASNDNWITTIIGGIITSNQVPDIMNSGYAPGDARESAIVADLAPGNYTAIVRGFSNTTGVGLVEVYDLD